MRWSVPQLFFVTLFILGLGGCGPARDVEVAAAVTPTDLAVEIPTLVPTVVPTVAPTNRPVETPTLTPTAVPTSLATAMPTAESALEGPPPEGSLGDTWTRPTDGRVMVYVPAGEFEMGAETESSYYNEGPVHSVTLDAFWLDQTEVTNAQYQRCVEAGGCRRPMKSSSFAYKEYYGDDAYDDHPVLQVTWYQAVVYCKWAGARLPTEAEWEYAACGVDDRLFPWGDEVDGTRLNYCDASCQLAHAVKAFDDGFGDTAPVASFPEGAAWNGALDMTGNAWEWMADWFSYYYPAEPQVNPQGPSEGLYRVIRGGAWDTVPGHARCAFRNWLDPKTPYDSVGFRCAISASPRDTE